jgi:crossover junction endodeoxyribonuclease RuvC
VAFLGIDPGKSGAMVLLDLDGTYVDDFKFGDSTELDVWEWLKEKRANYEIRRAALELVSAMPKQGVSSTFKFGYSAGFLRGVIVASLTPYVMVSPSKWQSALNCLTGGDKNVSKGRAQQTWPGATRWTHANSDAALLAEYARRLHCGLLTPVAKLKKKAAIL